MSADTSAPQLVVNKQTSRVLNDCVSNPVRLLAEHESNFTSQSGEDGITEEILRILKIERGTAVEFGAWDGRYLSNTAWLQDKGWRVCLIEGDESRFGRLRENVVDHSTVICLKAWVTPQGDTSLDNLLAAAGITDVDFLSIDIDGDDYHIFEELRVRPKIVCIEYNPTIPPPITMVGSIGAEEGASLAALEGLAKRKDYALVYATRLNAFFVRGDLAESFSAISAQEAYPLSNARVLISAYNGINRLVDLTGRYQLPWNPWSQERSAIILNFRLRRRLTKMLPVSWLRVIRAIRKA